MDAKAINKFPIREYLAARGIRPVKDRGYYGLYHSPLREDRTPSMKVDYDKNLWIDYGAGEGGTLIDLMMRMERCDAGEAMRRAEDFRNARFFFSRESQPRAAAPRIGHHDRASPPVGKPRLARLHKRTGHQPQYSAGTLFGGALSCSGQILFRRRIPKRCRRLGVAQPLFQGLHVESSDYPTRRLSDVPRIRGIYGLPFVSDAQAQSESAAQYRRAELGNEPCQSRSVHRVARTGVYLPRQRRGGAKGDR